MKHTPARLWDFPSALFLTLALLAASQRLYATNWASGLQVALLLTVLGVIFGLALGASKFEGQGVFWLSLGYSLTLIPFLAAWMLYQDVPWLERMISLGGRLGNSLYLFLNKQKVSDTILFVIFTSLVFWLISLLAGFGLTRRGNLPLAIAPAGILLFIIQLYDSRVGDRVVILAIYLFLCLLLLGRVTHVRKRFAWKETRVLLSAESWTDLNLAIPVTTLVLVLIAWIIPASSQPILALRHAWENITSPLQQTRKELGNAVAGLHGQGTVVITDFYASTLTLGLSASVNDTVDLTVRVPRRVEVNRYYWRARIFDQYVNNTWKTSTTQTEKFTPDMLSIQLIDPRGVSGQFVFTTPRTVLTMMVTPAQPIWVSRPSVISYAPAAGAMIDPLLFNVDSPIQVGEQYTVYANIYDPTIRELRLAGTDYPTWVTDRYLQLPDDLSPRISELAQQLTAGATTVYDKTSAITDYLRNSITYSTDVQAPPEGTDPLVWFLFDSRTGFCNYYATAEVLLLRSVGIPARLVVGFAEGEFQSPDTYIIRDKNSHAWPEVYFPGIGWVEFEPTTIQPPLTRPIGNENPTVEPVIPPEGGGQNTGGQKFESVDATATGTTSARQSISLLQLIGYIGLIIILVVVLVLAYFTGAFDRLIWHTRLASHPPLPLFLNSAFARLDINPPGWLKSWVYNAGLTPMERSFSIVYQSLRWLGIDPSPIQTPSEVAGMLEAQMPELADDINELTVQYQYAVFSQRHANLYLARRSVYRIRWQALRKAIRLRINAVRTTLTKPFSPRKKSV
jgi:transglutaminase-like putative cysteine protease